MENGSIMSVNSGGIISIISGLDHMIKKSSTFLAEGMKLNEQEFAKMSQNLKVTFCSFLDESTVCLGYNMNFIQLYNLEELNEQRSSYQPLACQLKRQDNQNPQAITAVGVIVKEQDTFVFAAVTAENLFSILQVVDEKK